MVALEAWFDDDSEEPAIIETAAELDKVLDVVAGWDGRIIVHLKPARPVSVDSEIPLDVVRRAAHEYLTSGGQRPTAPTWQTPPAWYPTAG